VIHRRGKDVDIVMDYPDEPFVPWATMFKLDRPDGNVVECVACRAMFLRSDLMDGELEENHCPRCNTSASEHWRGRPHRIVPPNVNGNNRPGD
jgi:hypothetical protein